MGLEKLGVITFVLGLILALVAGFVGLNSLWTWVLMVAGLIVGLLNVTDHEVRLFLLAALTFMISAGSLSVVFGGVTVVEHFLQAVIVFTAPAAAIVSLRALYEVAKSN